MSCTQLCSLRLKIKLMQVEGRKKCFTLIRSRLEEYKTSSHEKSYSMYYLIAMVHDLFLTLLWLRLLEQL
jgi:hypothetical protein